MTDVTTRIGRYDRETRTVPVTFTSGEIVHKRDVNAVVNEAGAFDKAATAARVQDVARGVAAKIELGAITAPVLSTSTAGEA